MKKKRKYIYNKSLVTEKSHRFQYFIQVPTVVSTISSQYQYQGILKYLCKNTDIIQSAFKQYIETYIAFKYHYTTIRPYHR